MGAKGRQIPDKKDRARVTHIFFGGKWEYIYFHEKHNFAPDLFGGPHRVFV
jgi:hypothetical protein